MALFGTVSADKPITNRNLIINGAMQVAQRATSVTGITTGDYRTADRWFIFVSSLGTWTSNVESNAPTATEFRRSANLICTTADSSPAAGDELAIIQNIEGLNCQQIKKGTANAESITISFWVKSSNTGTFICELRDEDNLRQISKTYTINSADTWEKETITFPPDTTGAFDNDANSSLRLFLWAGAGSNFTSGTLNSSAWASSVNANRVVGQTNLGNRIGNYLAITGVQLEVGTVATPYEWRDYGEELRMCQRYAYRFVGTGVQTSLVGSGGFFNSTQVECTVTFPVTMRGTPSATIANGTNYWRCVTNNGTDSFDSLASTLETPVNALLYSTAGASGTTGHSSRIDISNSSAGILYSAEL